MLGQIRPEWVHDGCYAYEEWWPCRVRHVSNLACASCCADRYRGARKRREAQTDNDALTKEVVVQCKRP